MFTQYVFEKHFCLDHQVFSKICARGLMLVLHYLVHMNIYILVRPQLFGDSDVLSSTKHARVLEIKEPKFVHYNVRQRVRVQ